MSRRVKVCLAYDGSGFKGFQRQRDQRTVQGEIEKALERIFKKYTITYGAGRTDTGVHALGQIIVLDVPFDTMSDGDVRNALNAYLPSDIFVRNAITVQEHFDPRQMATRRIYHYFLLHTPEPDIFLRQKFWWFPYNLDIDAMRAAAKWIEGIHDFTTFMKKSPGEDKNPVRQIYRVRIHTLMNCKLILFRIEGLSFLRQMVRNVVGALIRVGTQQIPPDEMKVIILQRNRTASPTTAPPDGLYLHRVEFGPVPAKRYAQMAIWNENELMEGCPWISDG